MIKNQLNDKWESILEDCLTEHGFTTFRLTINRKDKVKCSGVLLSITVEGRKDREFKIGFLTMKTIGDSQENAKIGGTDIMFKTEAFVYNNVMKKFDDMQKDLAPSNKFKFLLCYKATDEYVLMEDLCMRNFAIKDGPKSLDFYHMSLAHMELGRFHAFSFALKQRDLPAFDALAKQLNKGFFDYSQNFTIPYDNVVEKCCKVINNESLKNKLCNIFKTTKEYIASTTKNNDYQVICHGDLKLDNIFFTYDENDEPSEIVMLDYQLSTIGSPIMDFLNLLLTSGTPEIIAQHEMMLDIYYDSLKLFLKKFQCLSEDCYPKSVLKKDFVDYFSYALTQAIFSITEYYNKKEDEAEFALKLNDLINILNELNLI